MGQFHSAQPHPSTGVSAMHLEFRDIKKVSMVLATPGQSFQQTPAENR